MAQMMNRPTKPTPPEEAYHHEAAQATAQANEDDANGDGLLQAAYALLPTLARGDAAALRHAIRAFCRTRADLRTLQKALADEAARRTH